MISFLAVSTYNLVYSISAALCGLAIVFYAFGYIFFNVKTTKELEKLNDSELQVELDKAVKENKKARAKIIKQQIEKRNKKKK